MTATRSPRRRAPQDETVRLARQLAATDGPTEALRAIALLRSRLDELEAEQVDAALKTGYSWRLIAEAIGVSRQAAHRKHSARVAAAAKQLEEQSVAGNRLVIVGPVRVAVVMAREEAAAVRSRLVGTEHLLTGLIRQRRGAAATALTTLGVTLEKARHCAQASADRAHGDPETEDHSPPAWASPARLPFSRRGRQALEQALREAVRLEDEVLDVEHLLLALLRDPDCRAVQCLERLNVTPAMVEDELQGMRRAVSAG
jgi:hypothetical protein